MKNVLITPSNLRGTINIPPSKSMSHRAIFCAALSKGVSTIKNIILSDDIIATCKAMEAIGVKIKYNKSESHKNIYTLRIQGNPRLHLKDKSIDCHESGSTLRFLIPLLALANEEVTVTGRGRLVSRPLDAYYNIFKEKRVNYYNKYGELPLTINGRLKPGQYELRGDVSSQFITGLLFALPLLENDSKIILTTELESKPYVDMTLEMLNKFGVTVINRNYNEFFVKGRQEYRAREYRVEGDFSQAAFWLVAGSIGAEIYSNDIKVSSLQGDKVIINILEEMNVKVEKILIGIKTSLSNTKGITVDASQCPDLVPIVAVIGALSEGMTEIINAKRLRIKESDRLSAITQVLTELGADIVEYSDGLIIRGREMLSGGHVDSHKDHRIAMAAAIASICCQEEVYITNADSVNKSYPQFWDDFVSLGGKINEFHLGEEH